MDNVKFTAEVTNYTDKLYAQKSDHFAQTTKIWSNLNLGKLTLFTLRKYNNFMQICAA